MRILGIETSCDDTGIAILESSEELDFVILSNVIASQISLHKEYGGVYPTLAKREHEKNLPITLSRALKETGLDKNNPKLDAIAITYGPGLSPCLWTGIVFAQNLAEQWKVPLIPVDHIEAHLLIALLSNENSKFLISNFQTNSSLFPSVALIVSGGHTQLIVVRNIGKYEIIGETRDDAAGEAFDKTARILGLEYPGGPAIATEATKFEIRNSKFEIKLPRPMIRTKDYDFSFSGLKTAVLYDYQSRSARERKSKDYIQEMAHEIQAAIVEVLVAKTMRAAKQFRAKSIIIGGGVAANDELRRQLQLAISSWQSTIAFLAPSPTLSTDNGAMIAITGLVKFRNGEYIDPSTPIEAKPNLRLQ
ncbi:MAG: tRNA (adenosine(37)-N6)-threonylcarbamoyltransferase complex transferase subunit TsaD [Candidatus Wildermuthbacteria bacterium]|nr:tRNA (adenosine(37)-N6)-threonylcarbamoyltransferase complex transferase subunit TsaD [Candidatus Wildermuthbacteria bacterium]